MSRIAHVSFSTKRRVVKPIQPAPNKPKDRRYALLVGINYKGTDYELQGCVNDVNDVRDMLINKFGYPDENITLLTDETSIKPTYSHIIMNLQELVNKARKNQCTEFWFHYSGHGTSIKDVNGDELDGYDEVIVPIDYKSRGVISDDMIQLELSRLPNGFHGLLIFDSCNSGTMADLPYTYDGDNLIIGKTVHKLNANLMSISGCRDNELSMDTVID